MSMGALGEIPFLKSVVLDMDDVKVAGMKRKRGRPPNPRRGSLHSKNSITTDSPRSESTKNSDSSSATEEETCFTLRLILPCSGCGEPSGDRNLVVICDQCKKGYHQMCHSPRIPQVFLEDTERPWRCQVCLPQGSVRKSAKNFRANTRALYNTTLPYSPSKLGWNPDHLENSTHRYCYCGQDGVWKEKMLQCRKCLQWFHEKCVQCLEWPLLIGDLFYDFRCSVCTQGPEVLARLPLSWVDVTDLVLYQLHTSQPGATSFDLNTEILPHLNSVWKFLQVPEELDICTISERHSHVLYCLRHVRSRYHLGESENFAGPSFAKINPRQMPALSAQHWRIIRESLSKRDHEISEADLFPSYQSSQCDENSCSSTITTSSATSIASKTHFDIFEECRRKEDDDASSSKEKASPEEKGAMRKKLRPRIVIPQNKKSSRKEKKPTMNATVKQEDDFDEPIVTASLSMIPIPENFCGVNNPFYEDEGQPTPSSSGADLPPRALVRKWKLQPRDLVITKDGTVRCKRVRRRNSSLKTSHVVNESSNSNLSSTAAITQDNGFKFKSSMETQNDEEDEEVERVQKAESGTNHCRHVKFEGEKTLFQMAFRESVLASRMQADGKMQILLKKN